MKKYNFLYDQDGKQIFYYDKDNNEKTNGSGKSFVGNKTFVYFIWIGIIILLAIIGGLSYYLMKLVKERKKRLFELEDEFDYNSGENNENNIITQPKNEEGDKFGLNWFNDIISLSNINKIKHEITTI